MAQFPLQDKKDVLDAVNYVLSGPSGLGQDFGSFASNGLSYSDLTGNNRVPYTLPNTTTTPPTAPVPGVALYVAPIALANSQMLDAYTYKFTFAAAQPTPPFINGQGVLVAGVGAPYDGSYSQIGVVDCTTAYVTVRFQDPYTVAPPVAGVGTVSWNSMGGDMSTDCNAFVTVNSNTSVVVIGLQLNNTIFCNTAVVGNYTYDVKVTRYRGFPNQSNPDVISPGFYFLVDDDNPTGASPYIAYKQVTIPTTIVGVNTSSQETIFNNIIDTPGPGYYWYINDIRFNDGTGTNIITNCVLSQRSFSLQVVKP